MSLNHCANQPLEDKQVSVTRASGRAVYPANFMLVATMNPCPCGYYGDSEHECTCTSAQNLNYQKRLSGPLLDRIDMVIAVPRTATERLLESKTKTNSQHTTTQKAIALAKGAQLNRYGSSKKSNSSVASSDISTIIPLEPEATSLLNTAATNISVAHLSEALQYRHSS